MKIKNKDIILTNESGQYQKISFKAGTKEAHIWYDDINDIIVINGAIHVDDISSDSVNVTLSHNQLSNMNIAPYMHLTQAEYEDFQVLTDGSLVTDLHWHETVNGHKVTVNTGALPSGATKAFDIHIVVE